MQFTLPEGHSTESGPSTLSSVAKMESRVQKPPDLQPRGSFISLLKVTSQLAQLLAFRDRRNGATPFPRREPAIDVRSSMTVCLS